MKFLEAIRIAKQRKKEEMTRMIVYSYDNKDWKCMPISDDHELAIIKETGTEGPKFIYAGARKR